MNKEPSQAWIDDCNHFYGILLTGKYSHWCPEFDYLPIDETCFEFGYCTCVSDIWDMEDKESFKEKIENNY